MLPRDNYLGEIKVSVLSVTNVFISVYFSYLERESFCGFNGFEATTLANTVTIAIAGFIFTLHVTLRTKNTHVDYGINHASEHTQFVSHTYFC